MSLPTLGLINVCLSIDKKRIHNKVLFWRLRFLSQKVLSQLLLQITHSISFLCVRVERMSVNFLEVRRSFDRFVPSPSHCYSTIAY